MQFALLLFSLCEIACWIAILVYAYDRGGATESGLVAFAQLAPAVVFAPIGAAMGDRIPRIRMLALARDPDEDLARYFEVPLATLHLWRESVPEFAQR